MESCAEGEAFLMLAQHPNVANIRLLDVTGGVRGVMSALLGNSLSRQEPAVALRRRVFTLDESDAEDLDLKCPVPVFHKLFPLARIHTAVYKSMGA